MVEVAEANMANKRAQEENKRLLTTVSQMQEKLQQGQGSRWD